jgi:hypothetical protein
VFCPGVVTTFRFLRRELVLTGWPESILVFFGHINIYTFLKKVKISFSIKGSSLRLDITSAEEETLNKLTHDRCTVRGTNKSATMSRVNLRLWNVRVHF